jgi:hypothetical protein
MKPITKAGLLCLAIISKLNTTAQKPDNRPQAFLFSLKQNQLPKSRIEKFV